MNLKITIKIWTLLSLLWLIALGASAQGRQSREKLEAAKIGLISERLGLTPEQAQNFWPIYNEYSQKRRMNHQEFRQKRRLYNSETATDEQTKELLELGRKTKSREVELEKEYSQKMLKVINNKQLLSLNEAEREFKAKLLRQLQQRRRGGQGGQGRPGGQEQYRRENQERLKNKRYN